MPINSGMPASWSFKPPILSENAKETELKTCSFAYFPVFSCGPRNSPMLSPL